jgi:hypothetical protein
MCLTVARHVAVVETSINMKFCNMNDVRYDKWNLKLGNLHNINTKIKQIYKQISFTHA